MWHCNFHISSGIICLADDKFHWPLQYHHWSILWNTPVYHAYLCSLHIPNISVEKFLYVRGGLSADVPGVHRMFLRKYEAATITLTLWLCWQNSSGGRVSSAWPKKYLWLVGCPYCRSSTVGFLEESTTLFSRKTEAMIHYQGGKNVICAKQWGCRFVPVSELIAILIYLTIRAVHQKYVSLVHQSRLSCWNWVLHVCVCSWWMNKSSDKTVHTLCRCFFLTRLSGLCMKQNCPLVLGWRFVKSLPPCQSCLWYGGMKGTWLSSYTKHSHGGT